MLASIDAGKRVSLKLAEEAWFIAPLSDVEMIMTTILEEIDDESLDRDMVEGFIVGQSPGTVIRAMKPNDRGCLQWWLEDNAIQDNATSPERILVLASIELYQHAGEKKALGDVIVKKSSTKIWTQLPIGDIAYELKSFAGQMGRNDLSSWLSIRCRQIKVAEVFYKNRITELTAMLNQETRESATVTAEAIQAIKPLAQGIRNMAGEDSLLYADLQKFAKKASREFQKAIREPMDNEAYADRQADFARRHPAASSLSTTAEGRKLVEKAADLNASLQECEDSEMVNRCKRLFSDLVGLVGGSVMRNQISNEDGNARKRLKLETQSPRK